MLISYARMATRLFRLQHLIRPDVKLKKKRFCYCLKIVQQLLGVTVINLSLLTKRAKKRKNYRAGIRYTCLLKM